MCECVRYACPTLLIDDTLYIDKTCYLYDDESMTAQKATHTPLKPAQQQNKVTFLFTSNAYKVEIIRNSFSPLLHDDK